MGTTMLTEPEPRFIEFPALKEAEDKLATKQKALADIFAEAGPEMDMSKVTSLKGDSHAKVAEIGKLNAEVDTAAKERDELMVVARAAAVAAKGGKPAAERTEAGSDGSSSNRGQIAIKGEEKSFEDMLVESPAIKGYIPGSGVGPQAHIDVELKTLFQTTAGWLPETFRTGKIVDFAVRPIQVTDIIPPNTTNQQAVVYMEETTYNNTAAETAEGGTFPEAQLALTEQTSPVRKIAVWIPVTDEQLEDVNQVRGYLGNRLPFMLRQRLDSQILNGNGTAPNLRGFLNVVGIQTQAKGADPSPDAIYKAMVKVRVTGRAVPSATIIHPTDWQNIRLLRTADGIYIWGSPSEAGPERIWGLPIVQADALPVGTALVGDYSNYTELTMRRGIDVQVSNSHDVFFISGKQAVRADMRVALVVYRPTALCSVTGL